MAKKIIILSSLLILIKSSFLFGINIDELKIILNQQSQLPQTGVIEYLEEKQDFLLELNTNIGQEGQFIEIDKINRKHSLIKREHIFDKNTLDSICTHEDLRDLENIMEQYNLAKEELMNLTSSGTNLKKGDYTALYSGAANNLHVDRDLGVEYWGIEFLDCCKVPFIFFDSEWVNEILVEEQKEEDGNNLILLTFSGLSGDKELKYSYYLDPSLGYRFRQQKKIFDGKLTQETIIEDFKNVDKYIIPEKCTQKFYSEDGKLSRQRILSLEKASFDIDISKNKFSLEVPGGTTVVNVAIGDNGKYLVYNIEEDTTLTIDDILKTSTNAIAEEQLSELNIPDNISECQDISQDNSEQQNLSLEENEGDEQDNQNNVKKNTPQRGIVIFIVVGISALIIVFAFLKKGLRKSLSSVLVILILCSIAEAKDTISAVPAKLDLGIIQVGNEIKSKIVLHNNSKSDFKIKEIRASCGCQKPNVKTKNIPAGKRTELELVTKKQRSGSFSHGITIIPENTKHEPIKIYVSGEAVQSLKGEIGRSESDMQKDKNGEITDIGFFHENHKDLLIKVYDLKCLINSINDINSVKSEYFKITNKRMTSFDHESSKNEESKAQLDCIMLMLNPKKGLKPGLYKDTIEIKFNDERALFFPVKFLAVGNIYTKMSSIYLGNIEEINSLPQQIPIYCQDKEKKWDKIAWNVTGPLSQAINIDIEDAVNKGDIENSINSDILYSINLSVDQLKTELLQKGFLSCNIVFFQNSPNDKDAIKILVYGYN